MDTLDRFLIREFLKFFVLITLGMAVLFLGIDFLSHLSGRQLSLSRTLTIYLYRLPEAIQQFLPLGCLMGTLLVLSNMSRQNEILALYISGVGSLRIISTFVAAIATLSTVSFLVFDSLVPTLTKKQIMLQRGLGPFEEHALFSPRTGLWYRGKNLIYNVGRFVPQDNILENISIYKLNANFQVTEIIHARKAAYLRDDWVLQDGHVVTYDPVSRFPVSQPFDTRGGVIPEKPTDFKTLEIHEGTMRLKDLRKYIDRNRDFGLDTVTQQVQYHERVALVFAPLIFLALAVPFVLKPLRSYSAAKSVGLCFSIIFLYLLMFRISLSVGRGGHIPPFVAAWAPNFLFLAAASILFSRKR